MEFMLGFKELILSKTVKYLKFFVIFSKMHYRFVSPATTITTTAANEKKKKKILK